MNFDFWCARSEHVHGANQTARYSESEYSGILGNIYLNLNLNLNPNPNTSGILGTP
jgi:hypothetical protein